MKVNLLGVKFDQLNLEQAAAAIEKMIQTGGFHQIGTMNPEYLVRAQDDRKLAQAIAKMDLILADGIGIVLGARLKGLGRLYRIRGGDLVEKLAAVCAEKGYKIGLVGGERGVAEKALEALQKKYPRLEGSHSSEVCESNPRRWDGIKEKPRILLTALSFKGPVWIENLRKHDLDLVALEAGGVFNYLAGKSRHPPKIISRAGLEWLWRLFWEPWRVKRQLALLKFLYLLFFSHTKKPENS